MSDYHFDRYAEACRDRVEQQLDHWLPAAHIAPERLHAAMRYAVLGGGKRVRPLLAYAAGQALGVAAEYIDVPACTVELIHAYSLVHDDLPAMDDDDLRRGRPTCHKAYDEATAILVGDALQTQAFLLLTRHAHVDLGSDTRLAMVDNLAQASGSRGMAGGQALDIAAVGQTLDLPGLENMHIHKTGALILASVRMGILAAGEQHNASGEHLEHYAKAVGLAFQVRDDILDIEGATEVIGKTQGKDAAADKPTYPALLGLKGARDKARDLHQQAIEALVDFGPEAEPLRDIAHYIIGRDR